MTVVPVERHAATALEHDPIFVVPLEHERRVLVASGLPADRVDTCGPGREGIRRWADRHPDLDRPVILAGIAGGLDPTLESGTIVVVDEVVDPQGQITVPPLAPAIRGPFERARVATAGRLVCSAEAKLALGRSTGARMAATDSGSATLPGTGTPSTAAAASSATSASTSFTYTRAPSAANRSAMALPMPRPAPVTSTARSSNAVTPRSSLETSSRIYGAGPLGRQLADRLKSVTRCS